jgi:multidrug efflux pump subunit AcrB
VGTEPPDGQLPSEILKRVLADIEAIPLPDGYTMEWGGEYESSGDAQVALAGGIPLSMAMMVLISIFLFNNLRIPLIIWLTVPLSIIGVAWGLLLTGQSFGFMPLLGFLSLVGMLIKNAIVLLDEISINLELGKEPWDAVLDSSVSRARPVMMAAGTTVLGMIPLLADDFFIGMAVTIMAGLTFASILTLIVVPVLYAVFYRVNKPA